MRSGAKRHRAGPAEAGAVGVEGGVGDAARDLHQHRRRVGHGLVEDDVLVVEHLAELGHEIMRVDCAGLAVVGGELCRLGEPLLTQRDEAFAPCCSGGREGGRRLRLQRRQQLMEDAAGMALQAQMAREGPHR
jgi:hypothetical protein